MKKNRGYIVILLLFHFFFMMCKSVKKAAITTIPLSVTNPSSIERTDELIVLTRAAIEQKTGVLPGNNRVSITGQNGQLFNLQFDDLNKDGNWDEAVFICKFEPKQTVLLKLSPVERAPENAVVRAHVRMRMKNEDNTFGPVLDSVSIAAGTPPTDFTKQKLPLYLTEGPAWENDKVAFRLYPDTRNTKDIYGKTTRKMMMDTVGANTKENYHNLSDWGMDILAVGKSLGAGSLAVIIPDKNGKDTLIRLGGNNVGQTTYKKITDGPVRAVFQMHYSNWKALADADPIDIKEEISIWGGNYFYESKVTITNAPPGARLVTGLVNLKSKKANEINTDRCNVLYTYDLQSENKERLGLAVMINHNQFASFSKTPNFASDILNSYIVTGNPAAQLLVFRFYAGWERTDLLFAHEESFKKFLENEAEKFSDQVEIR